MFRPVYQSACIFVAYLLGAVQGVLDITFEYHNITVGIQNPGRIFSPGSAKTGSYNNNAHVEWFLRVSDPTNWELFLYPEHVDLESCCDIVRVIIMNTTITDCSTCPTRFYNEVGRTAHDPHSIGLLSQLPPLISPTGMVRIVFTSDHSVSLSGFAIRYFARHRHRDIPAHMSTLPASSNLRQLSIYPDAHEVKIRAPVNERIWLQVVYMNLTIHSLEHTYNADCRSQTEKIEVHDPHCSMDDCVLAFLCRHSYSITPITLVSNGHEVEIISSCQHHQPNTDCAVINYKLYSEESGPGSCPNGASIDHEFLSIDYPWILEHTFSTNDGPSNLQKTWWIKNTNYFGGEILISIKENQLLRSPDCSSERIEIYSGRCLNSTNLVTYFCGGVSDVYKLTASRFAAIRFIGHSNIDNYLERRFILWIHVGANADPAPQYYTPDVYTGYERPWSSPERPQAFSLWDNYAGLYVALIFAAFLFSAASIFIRYNAAKRRQGVVGAQPPARHIVPPPAKQMAPRPVRQMAPRPVRQMAPRPVRHISPQVPQPPTDSMYSETYEIGGVPPPAVYHPPVRSHSISPGHPPVATHVPQYSPAQSYQNPTFARPYR